MIKNKYTHSGYEIFIYDWITERELYILSKDGSIVYANEYNVSDVKAVLEQAEEFIDRYIDELSDKDEYVYGQCKE